MYRDRYLAFVLDESSREQILRAYPPAYEIIKAHHVTLQYDVNELIVNLFKDRDLVVQVNGYARDSRVECLAVSVNGVVLRTDRRRYHITMSHVKDARSVESKVLLIERPELITAIPPMIVTGTVELVKKS